MILRLWHGVTPSEKAAAFLAYMKQTGEPAYLQTEGNRGVMIISRPDGPNTEFFMLSLWSSIDDIKRFAGPDYNKASYKFSGDREFLLELEEEVKHFEVLSSVIK